MLARKRFARNITPANRAVGVGNAGIAAATAEMVAFLDDKTVAAHGWLAALVARYATAMCSVSADRWSPSGRRAVRAGSRPSSTVSLDAARP
jgi:hypothetical protein